MNSFTKCRGLWPTILATSACVRLAGAFPIQEVVKALPGTGGAVASESSTCSQIGIDLLGQGGNAVDALVGTTLCVGLIGMYHSGIGGGGFMLVRDKTGAYEAVDFRETAPAAAFEDMYRGNVNASVVGGLSVGVPGELRGLEYVHKKYGALPWRAVVNPAAHLARHGFNVSEDLVRYMDYATSGQNNFLVNDPVWAEDFAPNGTLVKLGDIMTRKRLADTLDKIALHGADYFYEGELAEGMVAATKEAGGIMTLADLRAYTVATKAPVAIDYRGFKVYATGSPSSGAVTLAFLKTMEQFGAGDFVADVNLTTHRLVESMRFAYGARTHLGDPDFVGHMDGLEREMVAEKTARLVKDKILDNATQPVDHYDPAKIYTTLGEGTSHVVTTDRDGMAVSLTTTVNLLFGSQIMVPGSGIILNDEMNDFSIPGVPNAFGFPPSEANFVRAGKRPLSSITPVMVEYPDGGGLFVVAGAAGGSRIVSSTAQVVWRVLESAAYNNYYYDLAAEQQQPVDLRAAVAAPRLHDQLMPDTSTFEWSFDNTTVAAMQAKGHNVTWVGPGMSSVQAIMRLANGSFDAVGEPRQKNSGGLTL